MEMQTTNKKQDPRVASTRQELQQALIQLLQEKEINRITIRELCETADVHRSTFYMHYQDIYDLLDQVEQNAFRDVETLVVLDKYNEDTVLRLMQYIKERADVCRVVFRYQDSAGVQDFFHFLRTYFMQSWIRKQRLQDPKEAAYRYEFLYYGLLGVVQKWLREDCRDSPEEMAAILWNMIQRIVP